MKEPQKVLRPDEQLLWESHPKSFALLEMGCQTAIIRKWALTIIFAGALLAFYLRANSEPSIPFILLTLGIALLLVISPVFEYFLLKRQTYWITTQRIFSKMGDGSLFYMERSEIGEPMVIDDCTSARCLSFGDSIRGDVRKQVRWRACHPKTNMESAEGQEHAIGLVFYNPERANEALELLQSKSKMAFPQEQAN